MYVKLWCGEVAISFIYRFHSPLNARKFDKMMLQICIPCAQTHSMGHARQSKIKEMPECNLHQTENWVIIYYVSLRTAYSVTGVVGLGMYHFTSFAVQIFRCDSIRLPMPMLTTTSAHIDNNIHLTSNYNCCHSSGRPTVATIRTHKTTASLTRRICGPDFTENIHITLLRFTPRREYKCEIKCFVDWR